MYNIEYPEIVIESKQAFITRQQPLLNQVAEKYGRDPNGLCIKVFFGNPLVEGQELKDALWGDNPINEGDPRKNTTVFAGSQVQNILWRHGISPRVYAIFEGRYNDTRVACQLTDFVEGSWEDNIQKVYAMQTKVDELGKIYGFASQSKKLGMKDIVNGKLVDPQLWAFDTKPYADTVRDIYFEKGRYGKIYYQNDEKLGLHGGPRHSEDRINYMKLHMVQFQDKVVWDVGCAGGFFLRYATDRGAKRAIGFDMEAPIEAAFHVGNLLGYFNIDYVACDLRQPIPDQYIKPDVAFFLSMIYHIEAPKRLFEADTLVYEDNGKTTRGLETLTSPWTDHYKNINFVGRGIDHGDKACYILNKS